MDPNEQTTDLRISEQFDLQLMEAANAADPFNADGTIDMVIIRPCSGRGYGSRIYEADMLAANHQVFAGKTMFDNHEAPEAKRARAGIPRPVSDIGGQVLETRWDPTFKTARDAEMGFGPGAVIGRCRLSDIMEGLVRKFPSLVRTSVAATATGLKRGSRNGKPGWIVEGIADTPETSVDLVTQAGAGGQVAALIESLYESDGPSHGDGCNCDSCDHNGNTPPGAQVTDDDVRRLIAEAHADLLAQVDSRVGTQIQEALSSEEFTASIGEAIGAGMAQLSESLVPEIAASVAAPAEERELAEHARELIESLHVPHPSVRAKLLADFGGTGRGAQFVAGPRLGLIEAELDADGNEVKSAFDVLEAEINAEADALRQLAGQVSPTVPVMQAKLETEQTSAPIVEAAKPRSVEFFERAGIPMGALRETPKPAPAQGA